MKKLAPLCLLIMMISVTAIGQNMSINMDGAAPDSSAMLDVTSTTKGLLLPRMTQTERIAITNPATSLMVYQTNSTSGFYFYNGSVWERLADQIDTSSTSATAEEASGVAVLKDMKSSGTNGGTFTSGAWQTRDLNTIDGDTQIVAVASNQFVLEAGLYLVEVNAPAFGVDQHKAQLYNTSKDSVFAVGVSADANSGGGGSHSLTTVSAAFEITTTDTFEVQHRGTLTRVNSGFGLATSITGVDEVYTTVSISKLDKIYNNSSTSVTEGLDSTLAAGSDAGGDSITNVGAISIGTTNSQAALNINGSIARKISTVDIGTANNIDDLVIGTDVDIIRLTGANSIANISGIAATFDGHMISIFNVTGFSITFQHEDGSSVAANRLFLHNEGDITLPQYSSITLIYSTADGKWIGIGYY